MERHIDDRRFFLVAGVEMRVGIVDHPLLDLPAAALALRLGLADRAGEGEGEHDADDLRKEMRLLCVRNSRWQQNKK